MISRRLSELDLAALLPGLIAGLIVVIIEISVAMAFAALIFTGELSGYISAGIGLMLFATITLNAMAAWQSTCPGAIISIQDSPAIILSLISIAVVQNMPGFTAQAKFATVVAAIILASILTGVVFWLLGHFKLGNLIRYIPYPVIGGFLAGTGLLLITGGISVMTDTAVSLLEPAGFLQPALATRWGAGLIFAVVLILMTRRYRHLRTCPLIWRGS